MKRSIIFILMLLIFLASVGIGYFYLNTREDQKKESKVENNIIKNIVKNIVKNETISTENQEEKVSPNAELLTITLYRKCGHEIIENKHVEKDMVNLNKNQIQEKFKGYVIETFSNDQISLYKEEEKVCNEHFLIGQENGFINIYKLNEDGEEELYESTNISIEYFPEDEKNKIIGKIEIIGKEELYEQLENFES